MHDRWWPQASVIRRQPDIASMVERAKNEANESKILTNFFNPSLSIVDVSFVKTCKGISCRACSPLFNTVPTLIYPIDQKFGGL